MKISVKWPLQRWCSIKHCIVWPISIAPHDAKTASLYWKTSILLVKTSILYIIEDVAFKVKKSHTSKIRNDKVMTIKIRYYWLPCRNSKIWLFAYLETRSLSLYL